MDHMDTQQKNLAESRLNNRIHNDSKKRRFAALHYAFVGK